MRTKHTGGLCVRMGSVQTCWVQRSVNGLGLNALVVSVKRKIQNLQGSCPLTHKEVVDAEVVMVSVQIWEMVTSGVH